MIDVFAAPGDPHPLSNRLPQFQYRWGFRYSDFPFPVNNSDYPVFRGNGSWMIIPGWLKHTSHFAQNAIIINHHLHSMNDLPPVILLGSGDYRCATCSYLCLYRQEKLVGQKKSFVH